MQEHLAIFIKAVQDTPSLPSAVRQGVQSIDFAMPSVFDQSYLEFIDEQIANKSRGPEWTRLLKARLDALTPYCDMPTLVGFVPTDEGLWSIRVDPAKQVVIHSEPAP